MTRVVTLTLLLFPAVLAAAEPCASTASCLGTVQRAQADTRSFTAAFTQVKYVSLLEEPLLSRGRISFRRPDRMRLEIREPTPALVLINGRQVSIPGLSEADAKAMAMAPLAAMFTQLGAIFSGDSAALEKDFEVTAKPAADGIDVGLVPRDPSWQRLFRRIDLRFAGTEMLARRIRLEDSLGDRLEVILDDVARNPDLPDSLFEPAPPTPPASAGGG